MNRVCLDITDEALEKAKEWKELGEKLNLDPFEMYLLIYHIEEIQKLLDKKNKK